MTDLVVLCYERDDLERTVAAAEDMYMPILSRTISAEAIQVIDELKAIYTAQIHDAIQVHCMEAIHQPGWTVSCDGTITSEWCPDNFLYDSGDLTPQGYEAWAQQLHTLM